MLAGPLGAVLVGLIAFGLAGFALWRLIEGVTDADRRGTSLKGIVVRLAHLLSAVIYTGLAITAGASRSAWVAGAATPRRTGRLGSWASRWACGWSA